MAEDEIAYLHRPDIAGQQVLFISEDDIWVTDMT